MKILQINTVNKILSTGRTCFEINEYLNEHGIECQTAYSFGEQTANSFCMNSVVSTKLHALLSRITGLQGYYSVNDTRKLIKYIKKNNIDIVHLRNLHSNCIHLNMLLKFLGKNDIATVITLHDCWFYTGKCTHYTMVKCYKWQEGCSNCPKLKTDNVSWFFDRTNKMWNDKNKYFNKIPRLAVVTVSDWLADEARKSFLKDANIITRIYNWIDMSIFKPVDSEYLREELGIKDKIILLGVASGWSNKKGLDSFLKLAELLDHRFIILLVGNIPCEVKLPQNIRNIKATDDVKQLVEYYSLADVFLQLSPEETFGKVVAESLACGTPAVVVNSTANSELIVENCGYIVPVGDVLAIRNSVNQILRMDKFNMKYECTKYVENFFDQEKCINQYIIMYEQILTL